MEERTKKLIRDCAIGTALVAAGFIGLDIFFAYTDAVQGREMEGLGVVFALLCFFSMPAAIAVFFMALVWKAFRPYQSYLVLIMFFSIVYVFFQLFLFMGVARIARKAGFHQVARDSAPLVAAIKQYETKYGKPPDDLKALVPEFLSALPNKGFYRYATFNYSNKEKMGNAWTLTAYWGSDVGFHYYPRQNYDEDENIHSKPWHKIEDWAMVY